jgi:hypothetical protein
MPEAEFNMASEGAAEVTPRFPGDPATAAAIARRCAQEAWKWAWLAMLCGLLTLTAFALAFSAGLFRQRDSWVAGIAVLGSVLPIGVGIYFFCRVYTSRKLAEMADACDTMNFRFSEKVPKRQLADLAVLPLFGRGHATKGYYCMEGEVAGWPITSMQYQYTTGSGKSAQVHSQTAVIVRGTEELPDFELCPKSFWRKVGELFGMASITFQENPNFSSAYDLRGPDEKAIRDVFTSEVLVYFADHRGWTVESRYGLFAVYQQDIACAAKECAERVATALNILRLFQPMADEVTGQGGGN